MISNLIYFMSARAFPPKFAILFHKNGVVDFSLTSQYDEDTLFTKFHVLMPFQPPGGEPPTTILYMALYGRLLSLVSPSQFLCYTESYLRSITLPPEVQIIPQDFRDTFHQWTDQAGQPLLLLTENDTPSFTPFKAQNKSNIFSLERT